VRRTLLAVAVMLAASGAARAQVPAESEFQVNSVTLGNQYFSAAAIEKDGDFVAVWSSGGTSAGDVKAQRYDASGVRRGVEFQVNTFTTGGQYTVYAGTPVATRPDGRFVVVWTSTAQDGDGSGVFGQLFDAAGNKAGGEFRVNTTTAEDQYQPQVAVAAHGTFVVVWATDSDAAAGVNYDVRGQIFDATGRPLGAEFLVNSTTAGDQSGAAVAMDAAGNFVVVWNSDGQDGDDFGVFAQRFSRTGAPLGGEFQVAAATTGGQYTYGLTRAADGRFVVAWTAPDGDGLGVFTRRFDAAGVALEADVLVNADTAGQQVLSSIGGDENNNFVVSWSAYPGDGGSGVFGAYAVRGQRFRSSGARRGLEFQANSYTTGDQAMSQVGADHVGNFVVSWTSTAAGSPRQDGSGAGVFAQRFGGLVPASLAVDTPAGGGTGNGNRVLEPGEVADVRPGWRNVNGADQAGIAGALGGNAGPGTHAIPDGAAVYPTLTDGTASACTDCYQVSVSGARPATHWDVTTVELLSPDAHGQEKRWSLHVGGSFADASGGPFYPFIETLLHFSVTGGCTASQYCPANATTRQEMAVFALIAKESALYAPPACASAPFPDVPAGSGFCPFIAELARRGVVGGCGGGNYCPGNPVTRQEMAVFALATLDPAFVPPACTVPPFADVPVTSPFCPYIAELSRRGVVAGCGGGNYCPAASVTRQEMAVFISGTFGLTLYGP
jgi:hypothetical protein